MIFWPIFKRGTSHFESLPYIKFQSVQSFAGKDIYSLYINSHAISLLIRIHNQGEVEIKNEVKNTLNPI